eukprot:Nk52_evm1s2067 gene=Nk52_evmTU1s2067
MRFDSPRLQINDDIIELDIKNIEERVTHAAVEDDDDNNEEDDNQFKPENYEEIIRYAHEFGHYSTQITLKRIQNVMSWEGIEDDVKNVIERCHQCHM